MTSESTPTLNSVCQFIEDCLHATAPIQDEGYPLIRTPNIGKGRLSLEGVHRVSQETYEKWTRRARPEPGDLILAREAPAGNVAVVREGEVVALGQRTVHLRPNLIQVDPEYLCYFLLSPRMQGALLAGETGATAKHVNMKDIRRLPLPNLHNRELQSRLGRMFGTYDDLIEINRRSIKLLEHVARLIYREWFVHLRFPGFEHANTVEGIPEGWSRVTLGDLADVVMGQSPDSKFYNDIGVGLPFHQGVKDFGLRYPTTRMYCSGPGRVAEEGDILVSVRAPVGRLNYANSKMVIGRGLASVRSKTGNQGLLFQLLKGFFFKEDIIGSGAIYAAVTRSEFLGIELLSPPPPVAEEFGSIVDPIEKQIRNLGESNERLVRARDLLLPRLMSGEIEV